ncbi:unnamed protein product [Diamesa hyperborea]
MSVLAIQSTSENSISSCVQQLISIIEAVKTKEIWALKILDSSGEKKSGFIIGNNNWLGSREQCYYANNVIPITINLQPGRFNRTMKPDLFHNIAPFEVTFKIVHAQHYSPLQVQYKFLNENVLNIGLCVPATCSNEEINNFIQSYFDNKLSDLYNNLELQARVLEVKDMKLRDGFFYKKSVLSFFGIILIIYCLTRLASKREYIKKRPKVIVDCNNNEESNDVNINETQPKIIHQESISDQIIDCFSYSKNKDQFRSHNFKPSAIPTIDGMRSISCIIIGYSHIYWAGLPSMNNPTSYLERNENLFHQASANAALFVDCFFTMSGFLAAHNLLKSSRIQEIQNNSFLQNLKLYGKMLLQRYIRLTPVYLIVMLISEITMTVMKDTSLFMMYERDDIKCEQ